MITRDLRDKLDRWIEEIQAKSHRLTKWEENFIDSIAEQLQESGSLSEKQQEILERIYSEKT